MTNVAISGLTAGIDSQVTDLFESVQGGVSVKVTGQNLIDGLESQIDHTNIQNIGTNSHSDIDSHIADVTTNPHNVDKSDVGLDQVTNDAQSTKTISINNQTGTTYTLQDSDHDKLVTLNNASAISLTVPDTLSTGFQCLIEQEGAGQVTISGSGSMNIRSANGTKTNSQYSSASIIIKATNECLVSGDMTT